MLHPLSYTRDEAVAMIGKSFMRIIHNAEGEEVAGHQGWVVDADTTPIRIGNEQHYMVSVQWIDREGNTSKRLWRMTKEQIRVHTRPVVASDYLEQNIFAVGKGSGGQEHQPTHKTVAKENALCRSPKQSHSTSHTNLGPVKQSRPSKTNGAGALAFTNNQNPPGTTQ